MSKPVCLLSVIALLVSLAACAAGTGDGDAAGTQDKHGEEAAVGVEFDPGEAVITIVRIFESPPDGEIDATLIGEGALSLETMDDEFDVDALWKESLDVDEDGAADEVTLVYDDEDGILFAYAVDTFDCLSGDGTASAGILMAVHDDGNAAGAPEGSGWYIVGLDAGECAAQAAMLWGCEFDVNREETVCGTAAIDMNAGTVTITKTAK
jgi:hypothetical protein